MKKEKVEKTARKPMKQTRQKAKTNIYERLTDELLRSDLDAFEREKRLTLLRYLCGKPSPNEINDNGEKICANAAEALHGISSDAASKRAMDAFHRYLSGINLSREMELERLYLQMKKEIRRSPKDAERKWEELAFLCYICGKKFPPYPEELQRERLEERRKWKEEHKAECLETQRKLRDIEETYKKVTCNPRAFDKPGHRNRKQSK